MSSLPDDPELFRRRKANFEQLPFSLGGMSYAFFEFVRLQAELVARFKPKHGEIHVLSSDDTYPLAYMLDAFLDHGRRVANAVVLYLSARHGVSLPSSMSDLAKRLDADPSLLPNERELLQSYWSQHGSVVKKYRDLAQHHALLASDCRIFEDTHGNPGIYLSIPNNPEVKSVSHLAYDSPVVHAFLFMRRVFYDTIAFVHQLSVRLIDPAKPTDVASIGPNIRTWISAGRQEGVKIATVDAMDGGVRTLLARLGTSRGGEEGDET
jgi:hypothetical protein